MALSMALARRPRAGTLINPTHRLSQGLVACWPLNETAGTRMNDAFRRNYGVLSGFGPGAWASTRQTNGKTGPGPQTTLTLDGIAEIVEVSSSPDFDSTTGTWVLWIRTSQALPNYATIMSRADAASSASGISLVFEQSTGKLVSQVKTTGGTIRSSLVGPVALNDGLEHQIGITFNGGNGEPAGLWTDGRLVASGTNSGAWAFNSQVIRLGQQLDSFWNPYGGAYGIIRWYNRNLTSAEFLELYANPFAGFADDDFAFLKVGSTFNESTSEAASASDAQSSTATFPSAIAESATAVDASNFIDLVAESASATDTQSCGITRNVSLTERGGAREAVLSATLAMVASAMVEAATASDLVRLPVWTNNTDDTQTWSANTPSGSVWTNNSHAESTWTEN